jgi:hypothetical protein
MKGKPGKPKDAAADSHIRVLKVGTCPSLSGRSTLTYHLGSSADNEIHLRIHANSGHGCFGRDWVALRTLQQALAKVSGPITSGSLNRVFAGRSQNTSGFVAAALLGEGLLEPLSNARGYSPTDGVRFMSEVRRLLEGGPSATVASVAARKAAAGSAQTVAAVVAKKAGAAMPPPKAAKAPARAKKVKR